MKTKTPKGVAKLIARGLESVGSPERIQELADLMMELAGSRGMDAEMTIMRNESIRAQEDAGWLLEMSDALEDCVDGMMREAHGPDAPSPGTPK